MYKLTFKLRTAATSKKTGEAPVSVVYRCDKTEFVKATGVSCKPQDFDTTKGRVKSSDSQAREKNKLIAEVVGDIEGAAKACKLERRPLTAANVQAQMQAYEELIAPFKAMKTLSPEQRVELEQQAEQDENSSYQEELAKARAWVVRAEQELEDARNWLSLVTREPRNEVAPENVFTTRIDEFLKRKSPRPKPSTIKGYKNLQQLVAAFNPQLDISKVNLTTLNEFQNWLIEVKECKNQSINSYTTRFKAILKEFADELGMHLAWFHKFKPVPDKSNKNIVFLTNEEIADIVALDLSKWKVMCEVREQFLLCCETGLRHSDLNKVTKAAIEPMPSGDGRLLGHKQLRVVTQKTGSEILVPITPAALEILERNGYSFPSYKLRNYNQALESIARRCPSLQADFIRTHYVGHQRVEEKKPKAEFLQSHAARRTFINNALLRGVSESTVATWVGHSDVKQIQNNYSHRPTQATAEAHKLLQQL